MRREERDHDRPDDERYDAELPVEEERRPRRAGQELPWADLAEELDRRQQERENDAERREHGDGCSDEQDQVDELLAPADPLARQRHRRLADDGVVRRHGSTYPVASAIFDCSSASCSSLSGTNWAASAIEALLSSMNSTKSANVLVLVERRLLHVDVERSRERRVAAVLRGFGARSDAATSAVDLECLRERSGSARSTRSRSTRARRGCPKRPGRSRCRPHSGSSRFGWRPPPR